MVVDVIFPGWVPFKNLAESQDIPAWIAAHDLVLWDIYAGIVVDFVPDALTSHVATE